MARCNVVLGGGHQKMSGGWTQQWIPFERNDEVFGVNDYGFSDGMVILSSGDVYVWSEKMEKCEYLKEE